MRRPAPPALLLPLLLALGGHASAKLTAGAATAAVAKLNATKAAVSAAAALTTAAVVDPTAPKFTGTVTCYVNDAGLVAGLQMGAAPALCSTAGAARSLSVPPDAHISSVKLAVDPAGFVGQLVFTVKSNTSLVPTNIVTCGSKGGAPIPLTPALSALSSLTASCALLTPAAIGRRLEAAPMEAMVAGTVRLTATTLAASGGVPTPPAPPAPTAAISALVADQGGFVVPCAIEPAAPGAAPALACGAPLTASIPATPASIALSPDGVTVLVVDNSGFASTITACTLAGRGVAAQLACSANAAFSYVNGAVPAQVTFLSASSILVATDAGFFNSFAVTGAGAAAGLSAPTDTGTGGTLSNPSQIVVDPAGTSAVVVDAVKSPNALIPCAVAGAAVSCASTDTGSCMSNPAAAALYDGGTSLLVANSADGSATPCAVTTWAGTATSLSCGPPGQQVGNGAGVAVALGVAVFTGAPSASSAGTGVSACAITGTGVAATLGPCAAVPFAGGLSSVGLALY